MPKTKGAHVLNAVKTLRKNRERALAVLPPHLHKYLEQRILPSSWYPLEDQLELLRAIASFMAATPDPWITIGRATAQMDLTGIYRNHVRADDPEQTLAAGAAIWRSTHDTGEVSTHRERPGLV